MTWSFESSVEIVLHRRRRRERGVSFRGRRGGEGRSFRSTQRVGRGEEKAERTHQSRTEPRKARPRTCRAVSGRRASFLDRVGWWVGLRGIKEPDGSEKRARCANPRHDFLLRAHIFGTETQGMESKMGQVGREYSNGSEIEIGRQEVRIRARRGMCFLGFRV